MTPAAAALGIPTHSQRERALFFAADSSHERGNPSMNKATTFMRHIGRQCLGGAILGLLCAGTAAAAAWEPAKPVDFVVPAAPAAAPTRWRA